MVDRAFKLIGGEDQTPVVDFTDYLIWERSKFVFKSANGESSMSELYFRDENTEIGATLGGDAGNNKLFGRKNPIYFQHGSNTLWRGRVADGAFVKGAQDPGRYRELELQATDYNEDLRGIIVDGWARPAETDKARAQALIAGYLSGNGRPTTVINGSNYVSSSNTVSLEPKTYTQTDPLGVLTDITAQSDKFFFITRDGELFYDGHDSTAYRCPYRFTDRPSEVAANPTHTFRIWRDDRREVPSQQYLSAVRVYYGAASDQYVTVRNTTDEARFAKWEEVVYAEKADNASQATAYGRAILGRRAFREQNYSFSAGPFTDAQIGSIKPGQLVSIKGTVFGTGNNYRDVRMNELHISSDEEGKWFISMVLGLRKSYGIGRPIGPKPPNGACTDLTATHAPKLDGESDIDGPWAEGGDGEMWVFADPGGSHSGDGHLFTHSLPNPWAWYVFAGDWVAGTTYTFSFWSKLDAGAAPATVTFGYDGGTGFPTFSSSESLTISSGESDWTYHEIEWTCPTSFTSGGAYNTAGAKFLLEYQPSTTEGFGFDDGKLQDCVTADPPPASDDDVGSVGTPGCYSPCDHKHPAQTAAVTPYNNATSGLVADDVQAALDELESLVGSGTEFLYNTGGALDIINTVAASGSTETLDLATGNVHDVTLTANCTLTLTGATTGKGCSITLLLRQDGTGSRTVTWPGSVVWPDATPPTLSTAAGSVDVFTLFTLDGGTVWFGFQAGGAGAVATALDDLTDVNTSGLGDGDVLTYDSGSSLWVPSAPPGGGGGFLTQAYVGYNTIGGTSTQVTTNDENVQQITLANDCLLTDIELYVKNNTANNQLNLYFTLYSEASSKPKLLLATGYATPPQNANLYRVAATAGEARWYGAAIGRWLTAGNYWIGWSFVSDASKHDVFYDATGTGYKWGKGGNTFVTDAPDTSGTVYTLTSVSRTYSLRANTVR